jgi:hypothetical protein
MQSALGSAWQETPHRPILTRVEYLDLDQFKMVLFTENKAGLRNAHTALLEGSVVLQMQCGQHTAFGPKRRAWY